MNEDLELTDRQIMVMLGVRDGKTIPAMTAQLGLSSYSTVQELLDELYDLKLVVKIVNEAGNTRMKGRELTTEGKEWLRDHGYRVK